METQGAKGATESEMMALEKTVKVLEQVRLCTKILSLSRDTEENSSNSVPASGYFCNSRVLKLCLYGSQSQRTT